MLHPEMKFLHAILIRIGLMNPFIFRQSVMAMHENLPVLSRQSP